MRKNLIKYGMRGFTTLDKKVMKKFNTHLIAGIDEVGMGPIAGPVVACAYIPFDMDWIKAMDRIGVRVTDSKLLSSHERNVLFPILTCNGVYAEGWVMSENINRLQNINKAGSLARIIAARNLLSKIRVSAFIVDFFPMDHTTPSVSIPKADRKSFVVACASIIAKVIRDRHMVDNHLKYPHYAWNRNMGYGTKKHWDGIKQHGLTPLHRSYLIPVGATGSTTDSDSVN